MSVFEVRVSTGSSKPGVEALGPGRLKVRVKAQPIAGLANAEVVELLARHFGLASKDVRILRGLTSHMKLVEIKK